MSDTQLIEQEEELWEPTIEDIAAAMAAKGWPSWDTISYDHIDDPAEAQILKKAVKKARDFSESLKVKRGGQSLMIIAGPVEGNPNKTGYGCGKTTLAKIIYYDTSTCSYSRGYPDSMAIFPAGRFYEARHIMALFDNERDFTEHAFRGFSPLLVIDDVGREGSLKWEKRDPDLQLAEKQDRYYSIINHCYERDISVVITSNMGSRELASFLGGPTWSRLLQMCPPPYRVNMTGVRDMRPLLAEDWEF